MKYKVVLFAVVALATIALAPAYLYAQQNKNGLSITPLVFDFSLKPEETKTEKVYLTNIGDQAVDITVEARNFFAQGEEGNVVLTKDSIPYNLESWITITPNKVTIPAKTNKIPFDFTVTAPSNPEPGGHYGAVVFSTVPKKDLTQTGAVVSQEVGALVFIKTPGEIKEKANIASFGTDKAFYEFGPVNFTTRVKNDSTIHISPTGSIVIKDMLGNKETIAVDPKNVLPGAIRRLTTQWQKNILIGQYTATLTLHYGSKAETLTANTSFWAFPIRWALLVLAVLIVILVINTFVILFFIRKGQKKAKQ